VSIELLCAILAGATFLLATMWAVDTHDARALRHDRDRLNKEVDAISDTADRWREAYNKDRDRLQQVEEEFEEYRQAREVMLANLKNEVNRERADAQRQVEEWRKLYDDLRLTTRSKIAEISRLNSDLTLRNDELSGLRSEVAFLGGELDSASETLSGIERLILGKDEDD